MSEFDVIVAGAGLGGLSTGALLASKGFRVLIVEESGHIGGRARVSKKDGFMLDWGLHMIRFCEQGPAAKVFGRIGKPLEFSYSRHIMYYDGFKTSKLPAQLPGILMTPLMSLRSRGQFVERMIRLLLASPESLDGKTIEEWFGSGRIARADFGRFVQAVVFCSLIGTDLSKLSSGEFARFMRKALRAIHRGGYPVGVFPSNFEPAVAPPGKQLLNWYLPLSREDLAQARPAGRRR